MVNPLYTQIYTNAIRKFEFNPINGIALPTMIDEYNSEPYFHLRNYNVIAQIFSDGHKGQTLFSGPFQLTQYLPQLKVLDVAGKGIYPAAHFS